MKNQLIKLSGSIPICKVCFKNIKLNSFHHLFNNKNVLCDKCITELNPVFHKFKIGRYKAYSLYIYDERIQELFYQYKHSEDYELKDIFINNYLDELSLKYNGFYMVPIPSYYEDDKRRGYNHVKVIFNNLDLRMIDCLYKTKDVKQKELSKKERSKIGEFISIKKDVNLKNKKILIVDDVITTGSSMRAAINLIEKHKPKKIEILSVAYTENK